MVSHLVVLYSKMLRILEKDLFIFYRFSENDDIV